MVEAERKLIGLGIFYKNDGPGGFGIILEGESARGMAKFFEDAYECFKASPLEEQEEYLSQMAWEDLRWALEVNPRPNDAKSNEYAQVDGAQEFITYGPLTIYILEREGRLVTDEFNGCRFLYEA